MRLFLVHNVIMASAYPRFCTCVAGNNLLVHATSWVNQDMVKVVFLAIRQPTYEVNHQYDHHNTYISKMTDRISYGKNNIYLGI